MSIAEDEYYAKENIHKKSITKTVRSCMWNSSSSPIEVGTVPNTHSALPHCTATLSRCIRNWNDLALVVTDVIRCLRLRKSWTSPRPAHQVTRPPLGRSCIEPTVSNISSLSDCQPRSPQRRQIAWNGSSDWLPKCLDMWSPRSCDDRQPMAAKSNRQYVFIASGQWVRL